MSAFESLLLTLLGLVQRIGLPIILYQSLLITIFLKMLIWGPLLRFLWNLDNTSVEP